MRERRLLFVRRRWEASLAPIYVALLAVVSVALFGFAAALWPDDSARPAHRAPTSDSSPASRSFEGASRHPPDAPKAPGRGSWM